MPKATKPQSSVPSETPPASLPPEQPFDRAEQVDLFCLATYPDFFDAVWDQRGLRRKVETLDEKFERASWLRQAQEYLQTQQRLRQQRTEEESEPTRSDNWGDLSSLHPDRPYSANLHVHNPRYEKSALDLLLASTGLALVGPMNQGKSWWRQRLTAELRKRAGVTIVETDLSGEVPSVIDTTGGLYDAVWRQVLEELRLSPNALTLAGKVAPQPGHVAMHHIFTLFQVWKSRPEHRQHRLIWALDGLDRIHQATSRDDFMRPLKYRLEETPWLRLLHCGRDLRTVQYMTGSSSSFLPTVGAPPDFSRAGIADLATHYKCTSPMVPELLWWLLRGHPYLTRSALHSLLRYGQDDKYALLQQALYLQGGGPLFSGYLNNLRQGLSREELSALQTLYNEQNPTLQYDMGEQLQSLGLVRKTQNGRFRLRCPLFVHLVW